jgi:hypothetical protein
VNDDGRNCVPKKDRADFSPVLKSDHTTAAALPVSDSVFSSGLDR